MEGLYQTQRIKDLKDKMLSEPRYASIVSKGSTFLQSGTGYGHAFIL